MGSQPEPITLQPGCGAGHAGLLGDGDDVADQGTTGGQSALDRGVGAGLLGSVALIWPLLAVEDSIGSAVKAVLTFTTVVAVAVAVTGATDAGRHRTSGSVVRDWSLARASCLMFAVQVLDAGAGDSLSRVGGGEFILTWITVVAGHFFPLAKLLRDPVLRILGNLLVCACARPADPSGWVRLGRIGYLGRRRVPIRGRSRHQDLATSHSIAACW